MNDSYKYILNGIEHEIPSQSNLVIQQKPLHEKILISQKYILKYWHDFMEIHQMEYFISHHTLLGHHLFQGIHLFYPHIEVIVPFHHFQKIVKMKDEFQKDEFQLLEYPHHMILTSSFFAKQSIELFIYSLLPNPSHSTEFHIIYPENQEKQKFQLYEIYPLQKKPYEEFEIYIPHKPLPILQNAHFNLHFIQFKENNDLSQKREIIQEPEDSSISSLFADSIFEPLSFMKEKFLSKR